MPVPNIKNYKKKATKFKEGLYDDWKKEVVKKYKLDGNGGFTEDIPVNNAESDANASILDAIYADQLSLALVKNNKRKLDEILDEQEKELIKYWTINTEREKRKFFPVRKTLLFKQREEELIKINLGQQVSLEKMASLLAEITGAEELRDTEMGDITLYVPKLVNAVKKWVIAGTKDPETLAEHGNLEALINERVQAEVKELMETIQGNQPTEEELEEGEVKENEEEKEESNFNNEVSNEVSNENNAVNTTNNVVNNYYNTTAAGSDICAGDDADTFYIEVENCT